MDIQKQVSSKRKKAGSQPTSISIGTKQINSPHVVDLKDKPTSGEKSKHNMNRWLTRQNIHAGVAVVGLVVIGLWCAFVLNTTSLAQYAPSNTTSYLEASINVQTPQAKKLASALGIDTQTIGDFLLGAVAPDLAGHDLATNTLHIAIAYTPTTWVLITPAREAAFKNLDGFSIRHDDNATTRISEIVLGQTHYMVGFSHGILLVSPNEEVIKNELSNNSLPVTPSWYRTTRTKLGINPFFTMTNADGTGASLEANTQGLAVHLLNNDRYSTVPQSNTIPGDAAGAIRGTSLVNDIQLLAKVPAFNSSVLQLVPKTLLTELSSTERQTLLTNISAPYVLNILPNTEQGRFDLALRVSGTASTSQATVSALNDAFTRFLASRTSREVDSTLPDGTPTTEFVADENPAKPDQQVYHGVTIYTYHDNFAEIAYAQSSGDVLAATSNAALQKMIDTEIGNNPSLATNDIGKNKIVVGYVAPKIITSLAGQFLGTLPAKQGSSLYTLFSAWQKGTFWVDPKHQDTISGQLSL